MKTIFKLLSIVLFCSLVACGSNTTETAESETVSRTLYGEAFDEEEVLDINLLSSKLEGADSLNINLVGTINSTCAMKGCWMKMATFDSEIRVSFKDYGFFVPKSGVEGKKALISGYAKKVLTDVETLKHFAEDAGKSQVEIDAITEPKEEITFVASGVIIEGAE